MKFWGWALASSILVTSGLVFIIQLIDYGSYQNQSIGYQLPNQNIVSPQPVVTSELISTSAEPVKGRISEPCKSVETSLKNWTAYFNNDFSPADHALKIKQSVQQAFRDFDNYIKLDTSEAEILTFLHDCSSQNETVYPLVEFTEQVLSNYKSKSARLHLVHMQLNNPQLSDQQVFKMLLLTNFESVPVIVDLSQNIKVSPQTWGLLLLLATSRDFQKRIPKLDDKKADFLEQQRLSFLLTLLGKIPKDFPLSDIQTLADAIKLISKFGHSMDAHEQLDKISSRMTVQQTLYLLNALFTDGVPSFESLQSRVLLMEKLYNDPSKAFEQFLIEHLQHSTIHPDFARWLVMLFQLQQSQDFESLVKYFFERGESDYWLRWMLTRHPDNTQALGKKLRNVRGKEAIGIAKRIIEIAEMEGGLAMNPAIYTPS
ncbi:hypothetical protein N7931_19110 [Catenovulum sp. 2E275]|uniref:hypothetical protein n=1 Tax=Catenovulum sp. 2E275 TaxID=2980497 RepID=UPI0021D244D0|nr:hypothetical protein [Catenovulum sp. 2E275]MCU4677722.1 hypothetical protein [Catenovulum sp. 2E275]